MVGNGAPAASRGALRMTSGCPPVQRTTTVNGVVGSRPSCSRTAARSDDRSSRFVVAGTAVIGCILAGATTAHGPERATRGPQADTAAGARRSRLRLTSRRTDSGSGGSGRRTCRSSRRTARTRTWRATRAGTRSREQEAERFVREMASTHPGIPGEWFQFAVGDPSTDALLGDVALCVAADDPSRAEIGFTFAPANHGRGYATEAVRGVIDVCVRPAGRDRRGRDRRRPQRAVDRPAGADRDAARRRRSTSGSRAHGATNTPTSCGRVKGERTRRYLRLCSTARL